MKTPTLLALLVSCAVSNAETRSYDPLNIEKGEVASETFEVKDASRDRVIPLRVYLPESEEPAPVVIFSHGLGGSRDNNPYLGNHWAKRGYAVVFVQHPGSDESVWKDVPARDRMAAMKAAASAEAFADRVKDVPATIDAITAWNKEKDHALFGRLDIEHIGMSGHSFGARTTQMMAGEKLGGKLSSAEKRIDATVMMSPSGTKFGDPKAVFSDITIPCLLMTGTEDTSPIGGTSKEDRLKVFPYVGGPAWQVNFDGAQHSAFGQRAGRGEGEYHQRILALTTAFWDAHLKGDAAAKAWLNGEGAKKILSEKDSWEMNGK
ncbi:MAG: alpha/beta fold hydrolase [Luteolibacter sp.]